MKKLGVIAASLGLTISSGLAQAYFDFDNTAAYTGVPNGATILIGTTGVVAGSDPTFATPNYDVSFLYQLGTANSGVALIPDQFIASGASNAPITGGFAAKTGDVVDGGGLYGLGTATILGTADGSLITVQAIAWYDPTGHTTWAQAEAQGFLTGGGPLTTVKLVAGTDPNIQDMSMVSGFTVGPIPEPSILALSALGAGALILRRRKPALVLVRRRKSV